MPKGLQMCTQIAGDVIYVPHGWAHGVLNLETSIGVAVEFSSVLQE
jgi:quercetin dioxygenase-like cupin family protein